MSDVKKQLRSAMRHERSLVAADRRASLRAALPHAISQITGVELRVLKSVGLYAATSTEASTMPLFDALTTGSAAFPRIVDSNRLMFHRVAALPSLTSGAFGILEPDADAPIVLPGSLDVIIVPGLAFDRSGGRLGWGGGFYDQALLDHPDAVRVGLAFSSQIVERVPTDDWDVAMQFIVTESETIQCKSSI